MQIMASGGERQSRRELEETIEQQKEQITNYEKKLRDLVRAYKGLVKEKEALEKSLAILNTRNSEEITENDDGTNDEDKEGATSGQESTNSSQRISTLTSSLATLSSEKSRLETNFQEDKKKLRAELNDRDQTILNLKQEVKQFREKYRTEIDDAKSKLIIERHNREKETNDHALMLRELQKLVTDERSAKENLEHELQQSQDQIKALKLAGTYNAEYEIRVRDLNSELANKNKILEDLQSKVQKTPPEIIKLKEELSEVKRDHQRDLERAEQKAAIVEERSASDRISNEKRVVNLESRLQELSETVGTYDRLRQQDHQVMQKLKERISQLDQENQSLMVHKKNDFDGDNDTNLDVQSLIERILRLRTMLKDANRRSKNPVDLEDLLDLSDEGEGKKWKKAFYQLKEEHEKLKITSTRRTPSPFLNSPAKSLKNHSADEDEVDEIIRLKAHIHELNEKLKYANQQVLDGESVEDKYKFIENELKNQLSEVKEKSKKDVENMEMESKTKMLQLEAEVQKQRERTIALIDEKDEEIHGLKSKLEALKGQDPSRDYMEDLTKAEESKIDTLVLHYSEEIAHNQLEMRELRTKKIELESALHEIQMRMVEKVQKYQDEIDDMNESMLRLKRLATKEGANLEYLKNVTLTYMLSTDFRSKEHMLKAIGAVLMFSDGEVKQVRDYNASWWPASKKSASKR